MHRRFMALRKSASGRNTNTVKCAGTGTRSRDHLTRTEDNEAIADRGTCRLRLNQSVFLAIRVNPALMDVINLNTKSVNAQALEFDGFMTTLRFRSNWQHMS